MSQSFKPSDLRELPTSLMQVKTPTFPVATAFDGANAEDWALTITDPVQRRSYFGSVVGKWEESDREAAAQLREKGVQSQ